MMSLLFSPLSVAPPAIFWSNSPVGPNQTAMLAGAHFPAHPTVELTVGATGRSVLLQPAQTSAASLMFTLPADIALAAYDVRVCGASGATCSNSLTINAAELWWVAGDRGNGSTAGGWVRLFGTALDMSTYGGESTNGHAVRLEERLQHALRSRDHRAVAALATQLAELTGGRSGGASGHAGYLRGGAELELIRTAPTADGLPLSSPIVLPALNGTLWDALFPLPSSLPPGVYAVSARNQLQRNWSRLDVYGGAWMPHVTTITVLPPPAPPTVVLAADFLRRFHVPSGGMNYSTGAPINATAALTAALAAHVRRGLEPPRSASTHASVRHMPPRHMPPRPMPPHIASVRHRSVAAIVCGHCMYIQCSVETI
jgi:hypothetical protein